MIQEKNRLPSRFYPIAPDYMVAEKYILAGIKFLQIRLKELSDNDIKYHLKHSVALAKKYDAHLVINDFWEYAIALKADWLHLGQEDLLNANMAKIKNAGLKFGLSTHDYTELQTALKYNPDYIALGPVYFTKLKAMKWHPQGLDTIKTWKNHCKNLPLVAIGGITLEKASDVLKYGADCVSFVTDITQHETPDIRLKQWIDLFQT
jgi:thiamine-phosphate pyrophosphorylase